MIPEYFEPITYFSLENLDKYYLDEYEKDLKKLFCNSNLFKVKNDYN